MKKYPKYKDSGVEWLGEIPEKWKAIKMKYIGQNIIGLTYSPSDIVDESQGVLVLRSSNIQQGKPAFNDCVYIKMDIPQKLMTRKGDILLCARNGSADLVGKNICIDKDLEGVTFGAFMTIYRTKYWQFFSYFLNSEIFKSQTGLFNTTTINQLTNDTLRSMKVALPNSTEEQLSIVQFLDHKTDRIDRFIANRQKQIELLKEQKAGIINKAVTKGIGSLSVSTERSRSGVETPNVKMKDSGIEWIGEVPEHWRKLRLKNIAKRITNGFVGSTSNILQENGVRYIQALHVKQNKIIFNQPYYVSEKWSNEHPRSILKEGDIVITQTGAMTGDVGLVASEFEGSNCHALIIVKPEKRKIIPEYLLSLLTSNFGKSLLFSIRTGSMHPHLNSTIVCDIYLPIPEVLSEQQSIIDFINIETSTIDTLISKYQKQIDLMQEYRTALISQAVTGKIDVREWKPKAKKHKTEAMPVGMAAEEN